MIRRIREHVETHNWFAVAVDLLIVVVGVFLGTQANNWNQDRLDRAEARQFRSEIILNLRSNEEDVVARDLYYERVRTHALAALAALHQPNAPRGEQFLIDAYQASQGWRRPIERTAFDELQSSGVARLVGDRKTRAALSSYYVMARGFDVFAREETAYRNRLRSAMALDAQLAIRARCDDQMRHLSSGAEVPVLPVSCRPELAPSAAREAATRLAATDGLDSDLTRLIVDVDQRLQLFKRTRLNAIRMRAQLEAA